MTFLIGPGIDELAPAPDQRCGGESPQLEGRRLILRLIIAFLLIVTLALVCFVVLPRVGLYLPVWVPLVAFVVITFGVLVNARAEGQFGPERGDEVTDRGCRGDGRAVGCCPGPRPPGFLRGPRVKR